MVRCESVLFCIRHPWQAIETKAAQVGVAIEHRGPPSSSTWEEFPKLPIDEAAKLLYAPRTKTAKSSGGVPREAWSKNDQERMSKGEPPKGYPEHPNI